MRTADIDLGRYRWRVLAFFEVGPRDRGEVLDALEGIGAPDKVLENAEALLSDGERYNFGLTYSNKREHATVMVIGRHTSKSEFLDSIFHEVRHLSDHIASAYGFPSGGEGVAYMTGSIAARLTAYVRRYVCDCREHDR